MRSAFLISFLSASLIISHSASAHESCRAALLLETQQALANHRRVERAIAQVFGGSNFKDVMSFELLLTTELLQEKSQDDWVPLLEIKNHVGLIDGDVSGKRAIAVLLELGLWESKLNPMRRTEKLIRLTPSGRTVIDRVFSKMGKISPRL